MPIRKAAMAVRYRGWTGISAVGCRRRLVVLALLTSAAAVLLVSIVSPLPFSAWFSESPGTSSPSAAHLAFEDGGLLAPSTTTPPPPPPLLTAMSAPGGFGANATIALPPIATPALPPVGDLDGADVDYGVPDSKMTPLWSELVSTSNFTNFTDPTETPPSVDAPPSQAGNSDAMHAEFGTPQVVISSSEATAPLTQTDQQLLYAKQEIEHAPIVLDDPEIYPPVFRNVSAFKRSYELMEGILKVYIYQEGSRPIFRKPELKGIYASEGWFMKTMMENKVFVVKDPYKAHLFYLPFSARKLEKALYVSELHNMQTLMAFLKNYVNKISAKYPFWNRKRGGDHFFVACHDWGPYITKWHYELQKNTIKALCNADLSEGVFVRGKDVSLPETTIATPRRPLRNVGGKPVSQRSILAFFAGNMHGHVRPILLQYWNNKYEDMRIFGPLPSEVARRMSYVEHMKSSKFCICPMGYEVNSPRIVEAIYYECVPVIIADNFVLPFEEVLNWSTFSVVIAEKDIPNLREILLSIPQAQYITMQLNVKKVQRHFLWHAKPIKYDIFHMILHSIWFNRINQIQIQS